MDYTVVPYRAVDREAYGALLAHCPGATPFHSLDWMPIYERFSPSTAQFLVCAREDSTLVAAMPVTVFRKMGFHAAFSSGFGVHGGPIARPECPPPVLARLLGTFVAAFGGSRTVVASVHDFTGLGAALPDWGFEATPAASHVVRLPGTYAELEKVARSTARYRVRRAARAGIRVCRSRDAVDFQRWQPLCSANYTAHRRPPYPPALYRAVAQRLQETDTLRFYVAMEEDRVVGGAVHVFAGRQGYYWMGATAPEMRHCGVADAVFQVVFQDAIREGLVSFDLGPSPAGADGLARFKEKWGGVRTPYVCYSRTSALGRIGAHLVRSGRLAVG